MIRQVIDRLLYTYYGQVIVSAVFGLALGLLFHKACKGKCTIYYAPYIDEVKDRVFQLEDTCYVYNPHIVKCNTKQKILNPYNVIFNKYDFLYANLINNI